MNRFAWAFAVAGPVAVVACAAWPFAAAPGVTGSPALTTAAGRAPLAQGQPVGVLGCAAAGCHGGPAADALAGRPGADAWTCAATAWLARDPHTKAYAALESPLAIDMMRRLTGEAEPGVPKVAATEDARCLACHTNPSLARPVSELSDARLVMLRREGVSCEACHGNAGGWLFDHTAWPGPPPDGSGMARLNDLGERALACAGCHVGAPAVDGKLPLRDMNHDMIAAGHPRLTFDFASYQRDLPPHWREWDRTARTPRDADFETQAWLVGRVAHAETAAALLADRARRAQEKESPAPWPEFAEFNCAACHHRFAAPDIDPKNPVPEGAKYPPPAPGGWRRPGAAAWQPVWPVTRPADLRALADFPAAGLALAQTQALLAAVEKARPNPGDTATAAKNAAGALGKLREKLAAPGAVKGDAVREVLRAGLDHPLLDRDRDAAWQLYHGLAAAERARAGRDGDRTDAGFRRAWEKLTLPRGTVAADAPAGTAAELKTLLK